MGGVQLSRKLREVTFLKNQSEIKNLSEIVLSSIFMGYLFALFVRHLFEVLVGEWYFIALRYILIFIGAIVFRITFYQYLREKKSRLGEFIYFASILVSIIVIWNIW
jgi:putative Ca2+/H+ antiporter (TMEM165/GDT1 family)